MVLLQDQRKSSNHRLFFLAYTEAIQVCENDISSQRQCIVTRGCATEAQCLNPSTGQPYAGEKLLSTSGQVPAGMNLYPRCCKSTLFQTDDAIAINYGDICNPASRSALSGAVALASALLGLYFIIL